MKNKKLKQIVLISIIFIAFLSLNSFGKKDYDDEKYFIRFDKTFKPQKLEIFYKDSVFEKNKFNKNECLIDSKDFNPLYIRVEMKDKSYIILNQISQAFKLRGVFFEKSISNRKESFVHVYYKTSDHGAMTTVENIKFVK